LGRYGSRIVPDGTLRTLVSQSEQLGAVMRQIEPSRCRGFLRGKYLFLIRHTLTSTPPTYPDPRRRQD
jgi:hypothetical protein